MKNLLFDIFCWLVSNSDLISGLCAPTRKKSLRIVYYHVVSEAPLDYYSGTCIEPDVLRKQIKYLKGKYEIISLYDAMERAANGGSLERCLSITFDDGFSECYSVIAPVLLEEKTTATFFLIGNTIDNQDLMWRNKLAVLENRLNAAEKKNLLRKLTIEAGVEIPAPNAGLLAISDTWKMFQKDEYAQFLWNNSKLEPLGEWLSTHRPYLSTEEIKEMYDRGFHFGSHTKTHPKCNQLGYRDLEDEIVGSVSAIGEKTGTNIDLFSYPFGLRAPPNYEAKIIEKAGLKCMLGIRDTLSNCSDPAKWERINLEKDYAKSISHFYLVPIRNRYLRPPRPEYFDGII